MNYLKIYNSLIESRKVLHECRSIEKETGLYFEKHHIVPRCCGGSDDPSNLIMLTSKEHFIAHFLLYKMSNSGQAYTDNQRDLRLAILCLRGEDPRNSQNGNRYINSRTYSVAREDHANMLKGKTSFFKGKKHSVESKRKMSKSRKGKPSGRKGTHVSEETKKVLSEHFKGIPRPQEVVLKISEGNKGKVRSSESKKRYSEAAKKQKEVKCPHCGNFYKIRHAKQWHFNKCKKKVLI